MFTYNKRGKEERERNRQATKREREIKREASKRERE